MPKCWTNSKPQQALLLIAGLLLGCALLFNSSAAETSQPATPTETSSEVRTILSTDRTVTHESIQYPAGAQAHLTAMEIVLQPGQQTGWHIHPVPLFGYILEGELTVDYGPSGQRIYRQGEGFAEATNQAHNGHNLGQKPVKILAVFMGMEGVQGTAAVPSPAR